MNVLNCLPKSGQAKAKQALHNIWQAATRAEAEEAFDLFVKTYEPKYQKATTCLQKDREELMAFYDFSAQHCKAFEPAIRLNQPSRPSDIGPNDRKAVCLVTACCT